MSKWTLSRRKFLAALGAGPALIPLLGESAEDSVKPRFIVLVKGNGCAEADFWPQWSGGAPANGDLSTAILPYCTEPLTPFIDRLIFPDGLVLRNWLKSEGNPTGDNYDSHHDWGALLTGSLPSGPLLTAGGCRLNESPPGCLMLGGSASIDVAVGSRFQQQDPTLILPSLSVGVRGYQSGDGLTTASWLDKEQPNTHENDPYKVFDTLFAGLGPGGLNAEAERRLRESLRVLDFVHQDINRFGKRLGTDDRAALEAHLGAIASRRSQLQALLDSQLMCTPPELAPSLSLDESNTGVISTLMLDMIVDAMKCGVTRSACFTMFDTNAYDVFFSWLQDINPNFGVPGLSLSEFPEPHFHSMTHGQNNEPGKQMYRDANRWHVEQLAYLLQRLAAEPEGSGTMLDSTVVLYVDSAANGAAHSVYRLPWILAGNHGGHFATGRRVVTPEDAPVNGLFVSIATALGVPPEDGVFGDPKFGAGELAGLAG